MRAEEKERKKERKENQEIEKKKSSKELFDLLQKSSSLHSLVSIKRAFEVRRVDGVHFSVFGFFRRRRLSKPGSLCGCTVNTFLFWRGGREVASEFGVCSVAAFYCWNVDGCRSIAVEKETESIMTKSGRREAVWRTCVHGNIPPKKLSIWLRVSDKETASLIFPSFLDPYSVSFLPPITSLRHTATEKVVQMRDEERGNIAHLPSIYCVLHSPV